MRTSFKFDFEGCVDPTATFPDHKLRDRGPACPVRSFIEGTLDCLL